MGGLDHPILLLQQLLQRHGLREGEEAEPSGISWVSQTPHFVTNGVLKLFFEFTENISVSVFVFTHEFTEVLRRLGEASLGEGSLRGGDMACLRAQ